MGYPIIMLQYFCRGIFWQSVVKVCIFLCIQVHEHLSAVWKHINTARHMLCSAAEALVNHPALTSKAGKWSATVMKLLACLVSIKRSNVCSGKSLEQWGRLIVCGMPLWYSSDHVVVLSNINLRVTYYVSLRSSDPVVGHRPMCHSAEVFIEVDCHLEAGVDGSTTNSCVTRKQWSLVDCHSGAVMIGRPSLGSSDPWSLESRMSIRSMFVSICVATACVAPCSECACFYSTLCCYCCFPVY